MMISSWNDPNTMPSLNKHVKLICVDGHSFEIPIKLAIYSNLIKTIIGDDFDSDHEIPLPNIKSKVFVKVLEFLQYHDIENMNEIEKVNDIYHIL